MRERWCEEREREGMGGWWGKANERQRTNIRHQRATKSRKSISNLAGKRPTIRLAALVCIPGEMGLFGHVLSNLPTDENCKCDGLIFTQSDASPSARPLLLVDRTKSADRNNRDVKLIFYNRSITSCHPHCYFIWFKEVNDNNKWFPGWMVRRVHSMRGVGGAADSLKK